MLQIKKTAPGILLCLAIAIPAYFLGKAFPLIGGPVFGILLGMMLTLLLPQIPCFKSLFQGNPNATPNIDFTTGINYTAKKLLQYSIILLGFEMNFFQIIKVGSQSLFVILFTLCASFFTAFLVGKALKMNSKMTVLIGIGTSICGGSAIAATAPVINAKHEDVAHAISTIFLFNILAVFVFPAFGHLLGMSNTGFGMWAGTAINDTSSVVAAAASWSSAAGNNEALLFATVVKLTRTLMIVPITLVLAIYTLHQSKQTQSQNSFRFVTVFPWFVLGFVAAALANTFANIPLPLSLLLVNFGKFVIIMAMVAIGINTNFKKMIRNGFQPIFLGLCCWFAVATVSLLVQRLIGIW